MKSAEWKTYRTRFLVQAKQLNSPLTFIDPLGRQHCGRRGDYLVESSDGRISIAPRQIFEDIYVPILLTEEEQNENRNQVEPRIEDLAIEALNVAEVRMPRTDEPARVRRKLPQSCKDRRSASQPTRLSLM